MTAGEFRAALAAISLSQAAFSRLAGVDGRTVQRWALGEREPPGTVGALLALLSTRLVAPPPAGSHPAHDRDEPCCQAIEPHLDVLRRNAAAVGWSAPEVIAAVIGWCVHTTLANAGAEAAHDLLADAGEIVEMTASPKPRP